VSGVLEREQRRFLLIIKNSPKWVKTKLNETMKNPVIININRVFKESSRVIREKLIRLEGDMSLSSLMDTIG
jgi:hypothetical protein